MDSTPAGSLVVQLDKQSYPLAAYGGAIWKDLKVQIRWSQGPIVGANLDGLVDWDHWHTNFDAGAHRIHIDFVSFNRMGPQTAYREYRVFDNGSEIGRGGGFAGFIGGSFGRYRNWPLAVDIENYLIYLRVPLQDWGKAAKGKIQAENPCSIWVKMISLDDRGSE